MSKIRPLSDRVLLVEDKKESITSGGIYLPEVSVKKPNKGKVLSVGLGRKINGNLLPMTVKVGDTVLFTPYAGNLTRINDEEVRVISEQDILCIVEGE